MHIVLVPELRLGRSRLRRLPAVEMSAAELHGARIDGLLPLHLFARVTFDPTGESITLELR